MFRKFIFALLIIILVILLGISGLLVFAPSDKELINLKRKHKLELIDLEQHYNEQIDNLDLEILLLEQANVSLKATKEQKN